MGNCFILDNGSVLDGSPMEYLDFKNKEYLKDTAKAQKLDISADSIMRATIQIPLIDTDSAEVGLYQTLRWEMMLAYEVLRLISVNAEPAAVQSMYDSFKESIDGNTKENCRLLREKVEYFENNVEGMQREIAHIEDMASKYQAKENNLETDIKRCGIFQSSRKKELKQELAELHKQPCPKVPEELRHKLEVNNALREGYQKVLNKNSSALKELIHKACDIETEVESYLKKSKVKVEKAIESIHNNIANPNHGRKIRL